LAEIEAQRAQALADLAQYKATSDYQSAGQAVAQIANLDAERQNIASLHSRYVESQRVPEPVELTPEQRLAKPAEQMDLSDGLEICKNSKYGKDLSFDDPDVIRGYNHMMAGRRARGE
jgi:hypothetical protein